MQKRYILLLLPALLLLLAPLAVQAQISAGSNHTCAILESSRLKCWGNNAYGMLGQGDTEDRGDEPGEMGNNLPSVNLGNRPFGSLLVRLRVNAVSAGGSHTCATLEGGSAKCWGGNDSGQLGLGNRNRRGDRPGQMGNSLPAIDLGTGRTAAAITAGDYHTCAILDDGSVKCWGGNDFGQLGLGDTENRGDGPGEMGNALPVVNLGTWAAAPGSPSVRHKAIAVAASYDYTCALLGNGSIKCWGANEYGQLGLGTTDGHGGAPGQMGDNLPAVDLGTGRTAVAITAGGSHTCALLGDGSVKCWGRNNWGQLGLGDTETRGNQAGQMGNNLPAVDLGSGREAVAIAAAGQRTCALLNDGSVKCWGSYTMGQLGLGDTIERGGKPGQMGDALPAVDLGTGRTAVALTARGFQTCALLDDGSVKCWGRNDWGQLGLGDKTNRGDKPGQMGDALPAVDLGGSVRVGVEVEAEVPGDDLALTARATAHGSITGRFAARGGETARLGLYDLMGRRLAEQHVAGDFEIGSDLASGLYLLRVETGAQAVTRSVVVVR